MIVDNGNRFGGDEDLCIKDQGDQILTGLARQGALRSHYDRQRNQTHDQPQRPKIHGANRRKVQALDPVSDDFHTVRDVLDVHVVIQPLAATFAAISAGFDATEWRFRQ